jgi:hypothetical protein
LAILNLNGIDMAKGAKRIKRKPSRRPAAAPKSRDKSKKLEAFLRAQKIDEILMAGNIQSQAASDSAVEERPSGESHIVDLLENTKLPSRTNLETPVRQVRSKAGKKPKRRAAKAKKKAKKRTKRR